MNGLRPQAPAEWIQAQQPAGDAHGAGSDVGAAHQHGPAGEFLPSHCNDAPLSLLSLLEYNAKCMYAQGQRYFAFLRMERIVSLPRAQASSQVLPVENHKEAA